MPSRLLLRRLTRSRQTKAKAAIARFAVLISEDRDLTSIRIAAPETSGTFAAKQPAFVDYVPQRYPYSRAPDRVLQSRSKFSVIKQRIDWRNRDMWVIRVRASRADSTFGCPIVASCAESGVADSRAKPCRSRAASVADTGACQILRGCTAEAAQATTSTRESFSASWPSKSKPRE